jgi:peptide/nickel transport system substrate-binding protein
VRQAMNYAVDKDAIVRHILRGYGRVLDGQIVGPDGYGYDSSLKPYPYDPERAKKLLAEAGHPNGFEIKFEGTEGRYPKDKEFEEAIVAQMAKAGIRLNLQIVDANVFIKNYVSGILGPVFIIGQQYLPSMDLNQGLPNFRSAASHKQLASKEFDALYEAQAGELDPDKRLKLLHQVSAWFREEAPVVFLHQYQSIFGMHARVKGFEPMANYNADLAKVIPDK